MKNYPDYLTGIAAATTGKPRSPEPKSAEYYEGYLTGGDMLRVPEKFLKVQFGMEPRIINRLPEPGELLTIQPTSNGHMALVGLGGEVLAVDCMALTLAWWAGSLGVWEVTYNHTVVSLEVCT
jgi:hypothetical protein